MAGSFVSEVSSSWELSESTITSTWLGLNGLKRFSLRFFLRLDIRVLPTWDVRSSDLTTTEEVFGSDLALLVFVDSTDFDEEPDDEASESEDERDEASSSTRLLSELDELRLEGSPPIYKEKTKDW